jgi:hypothetical protein
VYIRIRIRIYWQRGLMHVVYKLAKYKYMEPAFGGDYCMLDQMHHGCRLPLSVASPVRVCVCARARVFVRVCAYVCVCVHTHGCVGVRVCTCNLRACARLQAVYTNIYIYTHTHT